MNNKNVRSLNKHRMSGWGAFSVIIIAAMSISLSSLVLTGLGLSTYFFVDEFERTEKRLDGFEELVIDLADQVDDLEDSIPDGDGVLFFDDNWWMVNAVIFQKRFQFNASLISPGLIQVFSFPDISGTVMLEGDIPVPDTEFSEDVFAVVGWPDDSKRIEYNLDLIQAGVTREYQWPNKGGTIALVDTVTAIVANATTFLDSEFMLENYPDTTKQVQFDASLIPVGTTQVYSLPDFDGKLLTVDGAQIVSKKIIDASNTIVRDSLPSDVVYELDSQNISNKTFVGPNNVIDVHSNALTITGPAGTSQFNTSLLTDNRVYQGPDESGVLLLKSAIEEYEDTQFPSEFTDAEFELFNAADPNKKMVFDASGITSGQTRTLTIPDHSAKMRTTAIHLYHYLAFINAGQILFSDDVVLENCVTNTAPGFDPSGSGTPGLCEYNVPRTGLYSASLTVNVEPPEYGIACTLHFSGPQSRRVFQLYFGSTDGIQKNSGCSVDVPAVRIVAGSVIRATGSAFGPPGVPHPGRAVVGATANLFRSHFSIEYHGEA